MLVQRKRRGLQTKPNPIDLCALAINLGCTFVARSFSGSKKQLASLLKAAMSHKGFALIDVISPCVTFNNNDESMRSYGYVKENEITLHMADYIPHFNPVEEVEVPEGHFRDITLHDGSTIRLETISETTILRMPWLHSQHFTTLKTPRNTSLVCCTSMQPSHLWPKIWVSWTALCSTCPMKYCGPTKHPWMP